VQSKDAERNLTFYLFRMEAESIVAPTRNEMDGRRRRESDVALT
jgi:hypothetical protein